MPRSRPYVLDFETDMIEGRPTYPPKPVSFSLWNPGEEHPRFYAWGHPSGNNCTEAEARSVLERVWACGGHICFHNAKFDLSVAYEYFGLPRLDWWRVHDTMFLMFLADPHSKALDLKSLGEEILGIVPEERDEMAEWLYENRKELHARYPDMPRITKDREYQRQTGTELKLETDDEGNVFDSREVPVFVYAATKKSTGCWISKMPAELVGPYANYDTRTTGLLFEHVVPLIQENGMDTAYDRERMVLPILMENERDGLPINLEALKRDISMYEEAREKVDNWLRERLNEPELNLDADEQVAEALAREGVVDDDKWTFTKTGKRSVSKKALTPDMYNDPHVAAAFGYRNRLGTCLGTFMRPWLEQGEKTGGRIHTNWNQTRGGSGGTRTGRPSTSSPNLLNISKEFKEGGVDGYQHPEHLGVPRLPLVRRYIRAEKGHVLLGRDFSSQELRVFAHFERGELYRGYNENPELDAHDHVKAKMDALKGVDHDRTNVKITSFESIYGGGLNALMQRTRMSREEAKDFKSFHDKALPGRKLLNDEIKRMVNLGNPVRTWGGRCYYPEEPKRINGRMMDFIYKLLNYVVQGSAADITKQAMIDWHNHPHRDPRTRFLVQVYDEIVISCPEDCWEGQMEILKEVMNKNRLDVPILSDGEVGTCWGGMKELEG